MPYITTSDVVAAAPGIDITNTSRPSLAQVNDMITNRENALNATLAGMGKQVPIDPIASPSSFSIVKEIATHRVLADVLRARAYGKANPRDIGAKDADDQAQGILDRLADPNDVLDLVDAITTENQKDITIEGSGALEGQSAVDYDSPITRYTRF
jgi:hypothetical protein